MLSSFLRPGHFPGEIVGVDLFGNCTVKLDRQEEPVSSVLYYDERPEIVRSNLWQVCWPIVEDNASAIAA
jgi:hypothetical protein